MKPSELLRLVWINITQNKFKTIMTSIGIIVGAATIVMVIAIGKGGQEDVADQFKNLNAGAIDISYDGGDKNRGGNQSSDDSSDSGMMMMPSGSGAPSGSSSSGGSGASGGPSGGFTGGGDSSGVGPSGGPGGGNGGDGGGMPGDMGGFFGGGSDMEDRMNRENITLDEDDVDDIETFVFGISAATISYTTRSAVDGGDLDEAQTYSIAGVRDNYAAISNLSLAVGDFITESDDENKEKVCVLGASIAEEIFGSAIDAYGSVIYIDDRSYVVNGVLSSMGTVASGISPDDSVFIPYATGVKYLVGTNVSPTITVIAEDVSNVSGVTEEITEVLATSYPNAEFTFEDAGSKMEAASASNEILTMLLMAMAAIVFVVGGNGIMNVLFVSVKERTNEIGILKAIGCSQRNILFEFLAEAAAISLIGGVLGIVASLLVTPVAQYLGVRVELTPAAFLIALLFALITGTLFGFYPAYKASKLVPVEALGDHQKYVYAYVSSIEGNEVTYMEVDESVAKAAEERAKEKEKAEAEDDAGSDSTEQSGQMQMPPDMDSTEMPQGAPGGMSDMTGKTVTTMIPVGVTVHTTSDTTTTFSRLASGDLLKILVETDSDGNEIIEEIWMLQ